MAKIAVLGNSHVAALKLAYDNLRNSYTELEMDFFAARARGISDLELVGSHLIPRNSKLEEDIKLTSGGLCSVDLRCYDQVLIVGCQLFIPEYLRMGSTDQHRRHVFNSCWNLTTTSKLYDLIREFDKDYKISVIPCPMSALKNNGPDYYTTERDIIYKKKCQLFSEFLAEKNINIEFLGQPESTLLNQNHTKYEMAKGSYALVASHETSLRKHDNEDLYHMNREYGERLINEVLLF